VSKVVLIKSIQWVEQAMSPQSVSRFVQRYAGVQGFYFINRNADLGFIRPADAKPVKETFPQLHDRTFMRKHPSFVLQLENFLRDLQELSYLYLKSAETGMELGYILPTGENDHEWQSATLMVNNGIVDAIRTDQKKKHNYGVADSLQQALAVEELQGACSVHRGLNYLANYMDIKGSHGYFPVLFFQPPLSPVHTRSGDLTDRGPDTSLRVINLLWQHATIESRLTVRHDLILSILRRNLEIRGAFARDQHPMIEAESVDPLVAARRLAGTDLPPPQ
jgi:hypothetical protein